MDTKIQLILNIAKKIDEIEIQMTEKKEDYVFIYQNLKNMMSITNELYFNLMEKIKTDI
jgi:hypothetical protein